MDTSYEIPQEVEIAVLSLLLYTSLDKYQGKQKIKNLSGRMTKELDFYLNDIYKKLNIEKTEDDALINLAHHFEKAINKELENL